MEAMGELSRSHIPICVRGLPILVVDHDTTSLMHLASMLEQYSYKVTTTELASVAMSMIRERKNRIKLVMANINMEEDMNSLSFLRFLLKKDIPVILMSSERSEDVARKAIACGACLHLQKPISSNDLKYLWQHAYRNDKNSMKETICSGKECWDIKINEAGTESKPAAARNDHFNGTDMINAPEGKNKNETSTDDGILEANCNLKHGDSSSKTKRSYDDEEDIRKEKRIRPNPEPTDSEKLETTDQEGGKDKKNNQSSSSRGRKSRLVWNKELHHKFTAALSALGDKNARPKSILTMMNEPNLTLRQVASHLQKYKAQVQRISATSGTNGLPSVTTASTSIYGAAGLFHMQQKNNSALSHIGHQCSDFSIGPTSSLYHNQQFPNAPQDIHQNPHVTQDSTDSITSLNQTQQFSSMLPYTHQKLNFTTGSDPTNSLNQSQQFPDIPYYVHQKVNFLPDSTTASISLNQGIDFVVDLEQCIEMPDANKFLTEIIDGNPKVDTLAHAATPTALSENQNQHSAELANLLKVLDEEAYESGGSCIEPHPGEVDRFCEWLKEAMLENNEKP